jgi:putative RecB family exonuclease
MSTEAGTVAPDAPPPGALRGTVVHAVLERLHGLAPEERGPGTARELARTVLDELEPADRARLGDDAAARLDALLTGYYAVEDPRTVTSEARELRIEADLAGDAAQRSSTTGDDATPLRGYLDRLDTGPDGLTVVDDKSGPARTVRGEGRPMFGVRFYALLLARTRGVAPTVRLLHLGDATTLSLRPTPDELDRFAGVLRAVWAAIRRAAPDGDFRPNPGSGCRSCEHRERCPAQGGTPPPYPGWPDGTATVLPLPRPRTGETSP